MLATELREHKKWEQNHRAHSTFFNWQLKRLVWKSSNNALDEDDLSKFRSAKSSEILGDELQKNWSAQLKESQKTGKKPSLAKAVMKTYAGSYFLYGLILAFDHIVLRLGMCVVTGWLLEAFAPGSSVDRGGALTCAALLAAASLVKSAAVAAYSRATNLLGARLRAACSVLLYRKALRRRGGWPSADGALGLLSGDGGRLEGCVGALHWLWLSHAQAAAAAALLYHVLGVSAVAAIFIIYLVFVPVQFVVARRQVRLRRAAASLGDARVRLAAELVAGVTAVKVNGWERVFADAIAAARKSEMSKIAPLSVIGGLTLSSIVVIDRVSVFLTLVIHILLGNALVTSKVFTVVQFYNVFKLTLVNLLPNAIAAWSGCRVSLERMQEFLLEDNGDYGAEETGRCLSAGGVQGGESGAKAGAAGNAVPASGVQLQEGDEAGPQVAGRSLPVNSVQLQAGSKVGPAAAADNSCFPAGSVQGTDSGPKAGAAGDAVPTSGVQLLEDDGAGPQVTGKSLPVNSVQLRAGSEISPAAAAGNSCLPAGSVQLREASFRWWSQSADVLHNLSVHLRPGTLCAVIGPVGSGKTSLLLSLLGELRPSGGAARLQGSTSVFGQEAWVVSGSVRRNVLLGERMRSARYARVLAATALLADLRRLPAADATAVGERGAGLSGGQRARLALARAAYREADVYLLDDPLSAVDPHVANHVFHECVVGLLAGSTRLLVTHQLSLLPHCDYVIVLNQGRIQMQGTFAEIQENIENLTNIISPMKIKGYIREKTQDDEVEKNLFPECGVGSSSSGGSSDNGSSSGCSLQECALGYVRAATAPGSARLCALCALLLCSQVVATGSNYWVAYWSDVEDGAAAEPPQGRRLLVGVHGALLAASVVLLLGRGAALVSLTLRAARRLHDAAMAALLRAGLPFFQSHPEGALVAHCSEDVATVDSALSSSLLLATQLFLTISAGYTITIVVDYFTIVPIIASLPLIFCIAKLYITSLEKVKAFENKRRTLYYTHITDSLNGLICIRALGKTDTMLKEFYIHQDNYFCSKRLTFEIICDQNFWIDITFTVSLVLILVLFIFTGDIVGVTAGTVGVAVTHLLGLAAVVALFVTAASDLQQQLTAVGRALRYAGLPPETDDAAADTSTSENWPMNGTIEFKNVSLKYDKGLVALDNVSFTIRDGEKVAVVGRTGAGKSSLVAALLRLWPASSGALLVGGREVRRLPLAALRAAVALIPQRPALFAGSLRFNLDPQQRAADADVWAALRSMELHEHAAVLERGLEAAVGAGGGGWSAGQQQLVCLARAALRRPPFLLLDEATANIDHQTDAIIQRSLRELFSKCTVIIIAHRIHTVMDCDKVLVMDNGRLVQFGQPHTLLQDADGMLYRLAKESGADVFESFVERARETYERTAESSA